MEIQGYPNYLIYDDGRVFSKKSDRFLKSSPNSCGYLNVNLWNKEGRKNFNIHRLVAEHYIDNPENKKEIDHISRDKQDNRKENLRWSTRSENSQNRDIFKNNKLGI